MLGMPGPRPAALLNAQHMAAQPMPPPSSSSCMWATRTAPPACCPHFQTRQLPAMATRIFNLRLWV